MLNIPRRRPTPIRMEMSPLIDCIFLLLVFFMLSSTFLTPALRLQLPTANNRATSNSAKVMITIDGEGQVFVNKEQVGIEGLNAALLIKVAGMDKPSVTIRGDKDMRYEVFVQALGVIRNCGITDVRVAHATD